MLTFINSFIWPLLAAALIPLILHLLNRGKTKKLPFSAVRFLQSIEASRIKKVRLLQILLILVRTLLILALILAFGRIILAAGDDASGQATAVIIVDNSLSMGAYDRGATHFEKALHQASRLSAFYEPEDRVFVVDAANGTATRIGSAGQRLPVGLSTKGADIQKIAAATDSLFKAFPNGYREVFLFSDMRLPDADTLLSRNSTAMYHIDVAAGYQPDDLGIDSVRTRQRIVNGRMAYAFDVVLKNRSTHEKTSQLRLSVDKRPVSRRFVTVPAEARDTVRFAYVPTQSGTHALHFELDNDDLTANNHYYLVLNISEQTRVLYVFDRPDTVMQTALNSLGLAGSFAITGTPLNRWQTFDPTRYDLLLLHISAHLKNSDTRRIRQWQENDRRVVIIPTQGNAAASYNQILREISGVAPIQGFHFIRPPGFISLNIPGEAFQAAIQSPGGIPRTVTVPFNRYYRLRGNHPAWFWDNGAPFAFQHNRLTFFSADFNINWGRLPAETFFIPFLALRVLTPRTGNQPGYRPGDKLVFEAGMTVNDAAFTVVAPDGQVHPVTMRSQRNRLRAFFTQSRQPGFYTLQTGPKIWDMQAVNPEPGEWNRPPNPSETWGVSLKEITSETWRNAIVGRRYGMELTTWFILGALLMAALEMWIIKRLENPRV
ncbi:MAG: hypothetical protein D6677_01330 [Calditrichaeota bacterium]|nr:MAG: hypothetical protein D6677_01330 [Calditrichota bacterium]